MDLKARSKSITFKLFLALNGSVAANRKRRGDPGQDRAKDERRRKRLGKALKKMEKKERQPKPLIEMEIPVSLQTEAKFRSRDYEVPYEVK